MDSQHRERNHQFSPPKSDRHHVRHPDSELEWNRMHLWKYSVEIIVQQDSELSESVLTKPSIIRIYN